MPLALVAFAWLAVMTGINGNYAQVGQQFESDVLNNGQGGGFLAFMSVLLGIAIFFRLIGLPNAGRVFLILVLVVFLLENANVLTALQNLGGTAAAPAPATGPGVSGSTPSLATQSPAPSPASLANYFSNANVGGNPAAAVLGTTGETGGSGTST
jgi:hypothetical protein